MLFAINHCFRRTLIGMLFFLFSTAQASEVYSWSVVPQFTGIAVHRDWTPLLQAIEKETGVRFQLKIYESIPDFEIGVLEGKPDFAYMNPYHAVMANTAQGYVPLIRDGKRKLTGILVAKSNSAFKTLQDLQGQQIAFPSPNAFAASLYMRALLAEKEGIEYTPIYTKTHSNSFRFVMRNKTAASGGVYRTLRRERPEVQRQLQVIYKAPSTPSHPIVFHPRVPSDVAMKVQQSIIALANTETGKTILTAILLPEPIVADYARDYEPLVKLNLEKYFIQPQ